MSSDPSTPSQSAGAAASVTPGGGTGVETPVRLIHSTSEILDLFVDVLDEEDTDRATLKQGIEFLLSEHWRVRKWGDLKFFSSEDVKAALVTGNGMPAEILTPVIVKKIGCVVDYAKIGTLTADLTLDDVVGHLTASERKVSNPGSTPLNSPSRSKVQIYDTKGIPTIEKFSGLDEDFFGWKAKTEDQMGTAGYSRFLTDEALPAKHVSVSEGVFHSLRGALRDGQAHYMAQALVDDGKLDPVELWKKLEAYYDTALNRANVVLFDVRRLLNFRLTPDGTASKFITDFRVCLQRLRANKAKLADDKDSLRAFLLVAIQDDDFDSVRESIVRRPATDIEAILTEIREREMTLTIKESATNLSGDGVSGSRYSRRVQQTTSSGTSGGTASKSTGDSKESSGSTAWRIPKYPESWRSGFGSSIFKTLVSWRTDAHKGKTLAQLMNEYSTVVEKYKTGEGKNKSNKRSKPSGSSEGGDKGSRNSNADGDGDQGSGGGEYRKRIRLQKSRRIITERSA